MRSYFCGWYFRCQSDRQTLAVIPSVHRTGDSDFCTIQLITNSEAYNLHLPYSAFQKRDDHITIAGNHFGPDGIMLDIQSDEFRASGCVKFGVLTPLRYDIMGPFHFIPFMQCRHSVFSLHHAVNGELTINSVSYPFQNAIGYIEGDRGYSFPNKYLWTQCSFPRGAVMLSVADIPMGKFHFTGVIGVVYLDGKEYRLATYPGAKAAKISPEEIIIRQGKAVLTVSPRTTGGLALLAPINGNMDRHIREQLSCAVHYRFEKNGKLLLDLAASNAALEYEY